VPVVAPGLPAQLAFSPNMGGTSPHFVDCYDEQLVPPELTLFVVASTVDDHEKHAPTSTVEIGGYVILCYAAFTPGPVTERILGPDGQEVRSLTFTIDPLEVIQAQIGMGPVPEITLAANDFAALPEDAPGVYTITGQTPYGEVSTTVEVRNVVDMLGAHARRFERALVALLGRSGNAEGAFGASYVALANFAPDDTVAVAFYEFCDIESFETNYLRLTVLQATVGADGSAFVRLPEDIIAQFQPPPISYAVVAQGERTERVNGGVVFFDPSVRRARGLDGLATVAPWYSAAAIAPLPTALFNDLINEPSRCPAA